MDQTNIENFVSHAETHRLFVLPKLEIPLNEMTESELRRFVPNMYSMSSNQLNCKFGLKPPWWPNDVQWANEESDVSMHMSSYTTEDLQSVVISCYKYHGREDVLSITGEAHKNNSQNKRKLFSTEERITELHTICRLCLRNATSAFVNIFSSYNGEEIASIVSQHFWLQIFKEDGESDRLCSNCWMATESFHKFFKEVQQIHNSLPQTLAKVQQIKEQPDESVNEVQQTHNTLSEAFVDVQQIKEEPEESITDFVSESESEQQNSNIESFYEVTSVEEVLIPEKEEFFETDNNDMDTTAEEGLTTSIPEKSKLTYEACYNTFCEWMKELKIRTVSEKVMLAYFLRRSKIAKSPTLWTEYSKLKCMIYLNHNIDISVFANLVAFLKRKKVEYVCKQSKIFTINEFEKFVTEADDKYFLMMKVAFIIGIAGACRRDELTKLCTKDVVDTGDYIRIDIVDTKSDNSRQFVITEDFMNNSNLLVLIRKYISLRSVRVHDRFFVGYRSGKCTSQPVGVNTIGGIPKKIAKYLGLEDVEYYTGHCFRRSSPKLLEHFGANSYVS